MAVVVADDSMRPTWAHASKKRARGSYAVAVVVILWLWGYIHESRVALEWLCIVLLLASLLRAAYILGAQENKVGEWRHESSVRRDRQSKGVQCPNSSGLSDNCVRIADRGVPGESVTDSDLLRATFRLSTGMGQAVDAHGRAVVFALRNPEQASVLSPPRRVLAACFSGDRLQTSEAAIAALCRYYCVPESRAIAEAGIRTIRELARLRVLESKDGPPSVYGSPMVAHYVRARPVPPEVARAIIREGRIEKDTHVLDIGSGTGSLALEIAQVSDFVTGLDVSDAFLAEARAQARAGGKEVSFLKKSADELLFESRQYDVIVASQVMHWIDPEWACRGIVNSLLPDGHVFAVESKAVLPRGHPLREVLNYGCDDHRRVASDCLEHATRHATTLSTGVQGKVRLTGAWLFRQRRPFDMDFAKAYFFDQQLRLALPAMSAPWDHLGQMMAAYSSDGLQGHMYWLIGEYGLGESPGKACGSLRQLEASDIPFASGAE